MAILGHGLSLSVGGGGGGGGQGGLLVCSSTLLPLTGELAWQPSAMGAAGTEDAAFWLAHRPSSIHLAFLHS